MVTRRSVLLGGASLVALFGVAGAAAAKAAKAETFEVTKTDAEWRAQLGDRAWKVLRHEDTERAFSSPLNEEHRAGTFHCAGCDLPLFSSKTKFDSGTGWPSFWKPLDNAVRTKEDRAFGWVRTEVHCRRCGGHLGHVFDDGPKPTGLRYCMNGLSLTFRSAKA
jgi:peptide-methionine (R)-S-oxide reductase